MAIDHARQWLAGLGPARRPVLVLWWLLLCTAAGGLVSHATGFDRWLDRRHDLQAAWWAPSAPAMASVTVDIDDASLRRLGGWPLRREVYAPAGQWLIAQGARAVVFGLLLVDARAGDEAFAAWLASASGPVLLGARGASGDGDVQPTQATPPGCTAERWAAWQLPLWARAGQGSAALPIRRVGSLTVPVDDDGVLRRLPTFQRAGDLSLPTLPLAVWQVLHAAEAGALRCVEGPWQERRLEAGPAHRWPIDAQQRLRPWMSRAEPPPAWPLWKLAAAAAGQLPPAESAALAQAVRGRVVFVGSSAQASGEALLTAQGWRQSTQWLAAGYDSLEAGHLLTPPSVPYGMALMAVLLLPTGAALALGRSTSARRPQWLMLAVASAALLLLVIDSALVAFGGRLNTIGWPLAALGVMALHLAWTWRRQLRQTHQALERARSDAAALAKVKSEFLAQVSHEVRTPLNALLGSAELLSATPLNDEQKRHVQLFRSAGLEMLEMLNDLLDLSKSEAGLLSLHRHPFSLTHVVAQQVAMFEARAAQKGLVLDTDTLPDLPEVVVGDAQRLSQVLRNLLSNAVKFTTVGRITLAIRFGRHRDELHFEVRDTGIGISAERIGQLFTPYQQLHDGPQARLGGTGLGLAISRRLVDLMGGQISVQSREGLGSVFHVVLPLPATAAEPTGPDGELLGTGSPGSRLGGAPARLGNTSPAPLAGTAAADWRVLAADDSALNLLLLRAFLEGAGLRVDTVPDGAAALRHFERQLYQAVLLDLHMPVKDGMATVRLMREIEQRRGRTPARIVAVTGVGEPALTGTLLGAGFDACVAKPFTRAQLIEVVAGDAARRLASPSAPGMLGSAVNSSWISAISRLPDNNLGEALQRVGSPALFDRMVLAGRGPLENFDAGLAQALDRVPCDLEAAHRLAHDLRTLAAMLGLSGLVVDARRLEQALAETVAPDQDDRLRAARERVSRRLEGVCEALRQAAGPVERRA